MRAELPIDPRIQARRMEVRRNGGRRRRQITVAAGAATVLVVLAWGAGRSPLLAVHHVDVVGTGPTTRDAAMVAAGLDHHRQMLDLNPAAMRGRIEALPWVARAVVRRHWPASVEIALTARTPVGQVVGPDGQAAIADREGRVLAVGRDATAVLSRPGAHLPEILGVGTAGGPGTALPAMFRPALALATAVPGALSAVPPPGAGGALAAVTIKADGTWVALLDSGISVLFGSADDLEAKLVAVRTVFQRVDMAGVALIDVRVPDTPVLTRGTRTSMVSTIPRG